MIDIPDTIFPTNDKGEKICPACNKPVPECTCQSFDPGQPKTDHYTPRVRLEKKGRRGKAVTVIFGLPPKEAYLKRLAKQLKARAGSGGTSYVQDGEGVVEIQGDQRDAAADFLRGQGFAGA